MKNNKLYKNNKVYSNKLGYNAVNVYKSTYLKS